MALAQTRTGQLALGSGAVPRASTNSTIPTTHAQSPADNQLVSDVLEMFRRARARRRPLVDKWLHNYDILMNRTWMNTRADWMPSPALPEIYPILSSIVGWQTDQRIRFDAVPAAEAHSLTYKYYDQLCRDLRQTVNSVWENENYDDEIRKVIWDAYIYGIGIAKTIWDSRAAGGLGDPIITRVDPFTFYPDPDARSMRDMNHCFEVKTLSRDECEARWPGSLAKIGGGTTSGLIGSDEQSPTLIDNSRTSNIRTQPSAAIPPNTDPRYYRTNRADTTEAQGVTIIEAWLRIPVIEDGFPEQPGFDAAAHDNPLFDADGSPANYNSGSSYHADSDSKRRYDSWRCIIIAGNTVISNYDVSDIWSHGQHPYDRYVIDDVGEFWGVSMVELLRPAQLSLNRLLAAIEQNIWLAGNPVLVEDTRAGLRQTQITNKPGARLKKNDGGNIEWMNPPQIHPQVADTLVQFYIGEMERISGLSAIVRGATPTGRNAQGVLDSVQDAAFVRIRKAQRSLEVTLRGALNKVASLVTEFYDRPRLVTLMGDSGEKSATTLRSLHWYLPTAEGRAPMRFAILVQGGSSLPTSHGQRAAEADTLFAMGAIDGEAVLEAHDWPGRDQITARVRELQAMNGTLGQPPGTRQRAQRKS